MGSRVLARARAAKSVCLEKTRQTGRLRMALQVHADPQGHRTRLGYYADLFLTLDEPEQDDGQSSNSPVQGEHHIGYISTWRLSKEPLQYTHEDVQPWVGDWLRGELGAPDDDSRPFKETMRLLYDESGQVQAITDPSLRASLGAAGSELIVVEMIWIKYQDEATGFQVSFDTYNSPREVRTNRSRLVLLPTHCIACFRTALLDYEQRNSASVVQR